MCVHFFLVAYNTDAIKNEDFRIDAYTAECIFAGEFSLPVSYIHNEVRALFRRRALFVLAARLPWLLETHDV